MVSEWSTLPTIGELKMPIMRKEEWDVMMKFRNRSMGQIKRRIRERKEREDSNNSFAKKVCEFAQHECY